MALIFILSAQPGLRVSSDASIDGPIRHAAHVITYAVLALLLTRALGGSEPRPSWRMVALAAGLTLLYGVTDELHQLTVPDRTGQAVDLVWDGLGAAIGAAIAAPALRRFAAREPTAEDDRQDR
jgi:VanZ family protein